MHLKTRQSGSKISSPSTTCFNIDTGVVWYTIIIIISLTSMHATPYLNIKSVQFKESDTDNKNSGPTTISIHFPPSGSCELAVPTRRTIS